MSMDLFALKQRSPEMPLLNLLASKLSFCANFVLKVLQHGIIPRFDYALGFGSVCARAGRATGASARTIQERVSGIWMHPRQSSSPHHSNC